MTKKLVLFMGLSVVVLSINAAAAPDDEMVVASVSVRTPSPAEKEAIAALGEFRESPTGSFASHKRFSPLPSSAQQTNVGIGNAGKGKSKTSFNRKSKMPVIERMAQGACESDGTPCTIEKQDELRKILKTAEFTRLIIGGKSLVCSFKNCPVVRKGERNARAHLLSFHYGIRWKNPKSGNLSKVPDSLWHR